MNVLFWNPPWFEFDFKDGKREIRKGVRSGSRWPHTVPYHTTPGDYTFGYYSPYPHFLGAAATYTQKHTKAKVSFRDSIALQESYQSGFDWVKRQEPDLIFIETATPSWDHDKKLIAYLATVVPQAKIAIGGTIATTMGQTILKSSPNVVAVMKGEMEKNCVKVIEGATGIVEFDLMTQDEMNLAPFPYYDNSIAHLYCDSNPIGTTFPHAQVMASRGCMFKCEFCAWPATMTGNDPDGSKPRKVRFYGNGYMGDYLGQLKAKYHYRSIYFDDDTFNLSDRHTSAMCGVMRKVQLPWGAMCRADTSSDEVWKEMKDSGCYGVKIGFETGSQRIIDKVIGKKLDLKAAEETRWKLHKLGLSVHGTFMLGHPSETPEEKKETLAMIDRLKLTPEFNGSYQLSATAVIEGTPLHNIVKGDHLKAYPEAVIDHNFQFATDGAKAVSQHLLT